MVKEREDKLDPTQPTLIVQHGNTPRKYRLLEKEALVLGRAPGCDLRLEAPEVAPIHCVIVRAADGWRVRDCTGRGGTRVNGRSVQDEALCDEDVLQVGSFSFTFHLPPERRRVADADRLQRSRQGFARLALRMRGRLRQAAADVAARVEERLSARQEELDRQAEELDDLRSDLDARLGEMRRMRQEIAEESLALIKRHERLEKELAERRAAQERAEAEADREAARRLEIRRGSWGITPPPWAAAGSASATTKRVLPPGGRNGCTSRRRRRPGSPGKSPRSAARRRCCGSSGRKWCG